MRCTFWICQKCDNGEHILMCSPYAIMDIPNTHIKGVVFVLSSRYWHCCLVTSKDKQDKHCAMSCWVLSNFILWNCIQLCQIWSEEIVWHTACVHAHEPDIKSCQIWFLLVSNFWNGIKSNSDAKSRFASMFVMIRCGSWNHTSNLSIIQAGTLFSGS